MSIRHLLAVAAALVAGLGSATPAAAHVLVQPATTTAYDLTAGRVWSLVAVVLGLVAVVVGWLARAGRIGAKGAIVALAAGLSCMVIGGLVVANSDGGPGTGGGIVGGYVALVVGLIGLVLGGLALSRSRAANRQL